MGPLYTGGDPVGCVHAAGLVWRQSTSPAGPDGAVGSFCWPAELGLGLLGHAFNVFSSMGLRLISETSIKWAYILGSDTHN